MSENDLGRIICLIPIKSGVAGTDIIKALEHCDSGIVTLYSIITEYEKYLNEPLRRLTIAKFMIRHTCVFILTGGETILYSKKGVPNIYKTLIFLHDNLEKRSIIDPNRPIIIYSDQVKHRKLIRYHSIINFIGYVIGLISGHIGLFIPIISGIILLSILFITIQLNLIDRLYSFWILKRHDNVLAYY